ncbi:TetR/AcrR family transcriptional regulator [Jatrophihabitans cynanchi]|jgi:AcrR family transcriptional regulator|uniref:TetR/AcrR family transcriptional regulator n=1 Tax=Jatrophihabitans cynanchi TaxID=2944128 RepID=A0ABY7K0P1_9ACTN|nr:TetR family transcriptional regulator [Jatrophihabitans sp. SB3-54]WAX58234.1 TetR/AcrR family transcriptional regulator [Jatrophihabitans sp. SB3-54]
MPKIKAGSVAEHVARQEAAVFDAAITLFTERGFDAVSLGDIAAAVGLARNSLYRYFPDKAHILLRWFARELPAEVQRSRELLSGPEPARERIWRWAVARLDYAKTPEHALIANLSSVVPELDDAARAELADSHRQLQAPLDAALRDAGIRRPADRTVIAELIGALVLATAQQEAARDGMGRANHAARTHLRRAIDGLLAG